MCKKSVCGRQIRQNAFPAGSPPRTPLGSSRRFPDPLVGVGGNISPNTPPHSAPLLGAIATHVFTRTSPEENRNNKNSVLCAINYQRADTISSLFCLFGVENQITCQKSKLKSLKHIKTDYNMKMKDKITILADFSKISQQQTSLSTVLIFFTATLFLISK